MSLSKAVPNMYEVRASLKKCWSNTTAYPSEHGKSCPSRGQCYVTAILIEKEFGGKIMTGLMRKTSIYIDEEGKVKTYDYGWEERHYWNVIDGIEIDFTSDQYGGDGYHPIVLEGTISRMSITRARLNKRFRKLYKEWKELRKAKRGWI